MRLHSYLRSYWNLVAAGEGKFIFFNNVTPEKTTHASADGPAPTNAHTGSAKGTQCLSVCLF